MTNTSLVHPVTNSPFSDLVKEIRELGREAALGADALPKLALKVVKAASDGVINLEKDQDGKDDAARIYQEYAEAESKKALHNHSSNGVKANTSKLRQLIAFGGLATIDPIDVIGRGVRIRAEEMKAGTKVKAAYPAYVDVAREQIKNADSALTDDQLKSIVRKPEAPSKDVIDRLKQVEKVLDKLITGEGGLQDQSEETIAAHEQVRKRLGDLMTMVAKAELQAQAAKLGIKLVEDDEEVLEAAE